MTTVLQQLQTNMSEFGLAANEITTVVATIQALPSFQYSVFIWTVDITTLDPSAFTLIWKMTCVNVVSLIDQLEHGHWARPLFAAIAGVT